MQALLGLNLLFNIGAFFGVSYWLESRDPFIFSSFYYFYWVTLCLSFIVSLVSLLFYSEELQIPFSQKYVIITSLLLSSMWVGSSFGLTFLLNKCSLSHFDCHGEIISVSFSYPLALLWMFIFVFSFNQKKYNQIY